MSQDKNQSTTIKLAVLGDRITHQHIFLAKEDGHTVVNKEEDGGAPALCSMIKELETREEKPEKKEDESKSKVKDQEKDNKKDNEKEEEKDAPQKICPILEETCLTALSTRKLMWLWSRQHGDTFRAKLLGTTRQNLPEGSYLEADAIEAIKGSGLVILYDMGLDFRIMKSSWEKLFKDVIPPSVIFKTTGAFESGDIWPYVKECWARELNIVLSADDLRREEALVFQDRSWESALQDLLREFFTNPMFAGLHIAKNVIIQIGLEGVIWISNPGSERPGVKFIFDPGHLEGQWALHNAIKGTVPELDLPLVAFVAKGLAALKGDGGQQGQPDLSEFIKQGLCGARALLEIGRKPGQGPDFKELRECIHKHLDSFGCEDVPSDLYKRGRRWSLIAHKASKRSSPLYGKAREVALRGIAGLTSFPYGRFGVLISVDRQEIESLNGIKRLITDYVKFGPATRPLNLAVFGPPGAGKSFGIKQIAKGILGKKAKVLEFNLSQFEDAHELTACFHQVRDVALRGHVPLVFWDEFDSRGLFWLQFFLAPMQDGTFLEGQVSHPLGKAIFVFAGGTAYTFDSFSPPEDSNEFKDFKKKKGPDFVSRLRGYLNVLGPNRRLVRAKSSQDLIPDAEDLFFPVRRALILRAILGLSDSEPLEADCGLLNALLKISHYRHGARSLETIVQLTTRGGKKLMRSNLPPLEQLELHVDPEEFMKLVTEDQEFQEKCKELAPAIHEFYRELAHKENWKDIKYDMDWDELPPDIKADNMAAARRIPQILGLVGLRVARASDPGKALTEEEVKEVIMENARFLAEEEHNGWMAAKLENGWRYGPERDDEKKIHPCLVPFDELSEKDQKKDLNAVLKYPAIVARAGFKIVFEE